MSERICSVEGCPRPVRARGYCSAHYQRDRKGQSMDVPLRVPQKGSVCAIEDCDRGCFANGYCQSHNTLVQRGWEPGRDRRTERTGERNHMWSDVPGYQAAHQRVYRERGPAKDHACVDCGGPADEWSYSGGCEAEMIGSNGRYDVAYCPHPAHYSPRDRSCHRRFDAA